MHSIHAHRALNKHKTVLQIWKIATKGFGTSVEYRPIRSVLVANRGK